MLRRNTASQVIYFPPLLLTADGSAVTSGAALTVSKDGTESASAGTLTHSGSGVWKYTPTQAETNAAIVALILTYSGAAPVVLNLVTTGADTSAVALGANTTAPATPTNVSDAQTAILAKLPTADRAATQTSVDDVQTGVTTLLSRVTSTVAQLWADFVVMITGSGTAGAKFTTTALENAPSGGGDAEQATLEDVQTTVDAIAARVSGTPIETVSRVASGGEITAYVGDDFRVRSGTELEISVSDVGGTLYDKFTAIGVDNLVFGASRPGKPGGAITGTIADLAQSGSGASQLLVITVEIEECGTGLTPSDDYTYQIEQLQTQGDEIDSLVEIEGTLDLRRRVTA